MVRSRLIRSIAESTGLGRGEKKKKRRTEEQKKRRKEEKKKRKEKKKKSLPIPFPGLAPFSAAWPCMEGQPWSSVTVGSVILVGTLNAMSSPSPKVVFPQPVNINGEQGNFNPTT